jgi:hypothetical protein
MKSGELLHEEFCRAEKLERRTLLEQLEKVDTEESAHCSDHDASPMTLTGHESNVSRRLTPSSRDCEFEKDVTVSGRRIHRTSSVSVEG